MTTQSNFLVRASLPKGSMINEGGKFKATGSYSLEMQSPYGRWTLAIAPKKGADVDKAIEALDGAQVTMIYQPK